MTTIYRYTFRGVQGRHHKERMTHDEEKLEISRKLGNQKWLAMRQHIRDYMGAVHVYQLRYGDSNFGKRQLMTGREAHKKNKQYEAKFFNALDNDKKARLWKLWWVGEPDDAKEKN